jgi:RNA polymerase subunit RPABC4/transcription elongation factor Spt4
MATPICPECQKEVNENAAFCEYCGSLLKREYFKAHDVPMKAENINLIECFNCQKMMAHNAKICPHCNGEVSVLNAAMSKKTNWGCIIPIAILIAIFLLVQLSKIIPEKDRPQNCRYPGCNTIVEVKNDDGFCTYHWSVRYLDY